MLQGYTQGPSFSPPNLVVATFLSRLNSLPPRRLAHKNCPRLDETFKFYNHVVAFYTSFNMYSVSPTPMGVWHTSRKFYFPASQTILSKKFGHFLIIQHKVQLRDLALGKFFFFAIRFSVGKLNTLGPPYLFSITG